MDTLIDGEDIGDPFQGVPTEAAYSTLAPAADRAGVGKAQQLHLFVVSERPFRGDAKERPESGSAQLPPHRRRQLRMGRTDALLSFVLFDALHQRASIFISNMSAQPKPKPCSCSSLHGGLIAGWSGAEANS